MPTLKIVQSINALDFARTLTILLLVALLFSPALTNLFELTLFGMSIFTDSLRKRMLMAIQQPIVIAALCFYLLILLDTTYSIVSWKESLGAFWGWRKILLLPIAVALFDDPIWKQKLITVYIWATSLCATISFMSTFLGLVIYYKYPVGIIIRNHATQGIAFSVAAFAAVMLLMSKQTIVTKLRKYALGLCALILIMNIIYITPGRSGYLALIVLSTVATFSYAYLNKKIVISLIFLAIIPLLLLSSPTVNQRMTQGIDEVKQYESKAEETSMGMRMILWNNTFELILERPLLGVGTGAFNKAYSDKIIDKPQWEKSITHDPHNQFLKITTEQGFISRVPRHDFICLLAKALGYFLPTRHRGFAGMVQYQFI
jgi:O-antigen ligase